MSDGYMPKAKTHEWETPPDLFDRLNEEFGGFTLTRRASRITTRRRP